MSNNRTGARHHWYRGKKQSKAKGEAQQEKIKTTETSTETQENENKTCEQEKEEMSEDEEIDSDTIGDGMDFSLYTVIHRSIIAIPCWTMDVLVISS
jgi:uncharacterized FlaG/YvyC family protein